jgi:hypothetical protein
MDQERADYGEPDSRRNPWTVFQVIILLAIIVLGIPPVAIIVLFAVLAVMMVCGGAGPHN